MTDAEPIRPRGQDARIALLERDVREVLTTVRGIDSALRFPEQSPLGRNLIDRADRNAANIATLRTNVDVLEARFDEMAGVVKFLRLTSLLIGLVAGVFALIQVVRPPV
jgi:hypothetical protein